MSRDQSDPVTKRIAGVPPSPIRSLIRMILPQEDQADELHSTRGTRAADATDPTVVTSNQAAALALVFPQPKARGAQPHGQVLLASEGDLAAGGVLVMIDEDWIERQLTMAPELSRARRKNLSRLLATVERSTSGRTASELSEVSPAPLSLPEPRPELRDAG